MGVEDSMASFASPGGWKSAKVPAFRWVSRGHLDRYLAEFCYRFNRRFDLTSILPRLLAAAVSTPAMPQRLLKIAWMAGGA
jgi:hypothetical protein